jgi:hypothetical protein
MDYAIILCFDKDTESAFNNIIHSIADNVANSYMVDTKIPPHITIAACFTEEIEPVINRIDKHISEFKSNDISWVSLGTFDTSVLFAAPVLNEHLLNDCINMNRLIKPLSAPGLNGYYLPYHWVPHTSLAVQLKHDELKNAFDIALKQFAFISGKSNRILLAECNPYKEIKAWNLI